MRKRSNSRRRKGLQSTRGATASPLPGTDPSTDGTVVRKLAPRMPGTVVGVASEQDVIVLDADAPPQMVLQLLDDRSVAGKQLHVYDNRVNMVISRENLHDEARFRTALAEPIWRPRKSDRWPCRRKCRRARINATYANVRAGSALLEGKASYLPMVATSSFRITWMLPRDRTNEAVQALHHHFIECAQPLLP
jgi:hypothetical protein